MSAVSLSGTPAANEAAVEGTSTLAATGWWLVVPRGSPAPAQAQIKAQADYGGATVAAMGSAAMDAGTPARFDIGSLAASTDYDFYLAAYSTDGTATPVHKVEFTTAATSAPVAGACGSAHDGGTTALLTSAPTANLCAAGSTASAVTGGTSTWGWTCTASTTATCQAPRGYTVTPSAGAGGSISPNTAQTVAYHATPAFTVTPAAGNVVDTVSGCNGSLSGSSYTTGPVDAGCTVSATFKAAPPPPVNGQCGAAHGGVFTSQPTGSLCSVGNVTSVTGTGPWNWNCNGLNGGSNATCTASLQTWPVTASAAQGGTATCNPASVAHGGSATCTATASTGYQFSAWTGACAGQGATCTLANVTAAQGSTAQFTQNTLTVPEGPQAGQPLAVAAQPAKGWQLTQAGTETVASLHAPALPPGVTLPHGVVRLRLEQGDLGSEATVVLTYPQALPAGTVYYKYGRISKTDPQPHWYPFPGAQVSGKTITLTLKDGGAGDDDLEENRAINDPGGPAQVAQVAASSLASIPTLGEWALALLAGALGLFSLGALRRRV